jgi:hypothetical protein
VYIASINVFFIPSLKFKNKPLFSETSVRCVEPSNAKQKRHPNPPNSDTERKNPPRIENNPPAVLEKSSTEKIRETAASEAMYSDGEDSSAAVTTAAQHPKLKVLTAASSSTKMFGLPIGLMASLYLLKV